MMYAADFQTEMHSLWPIVLNSVQWLLRVSGQEVNNAPIFLPEWDFKNEGRDRQAFGSPHKSASHDEVGYT